MGSQIKKYIRNIFYNAREFIKDNFRFNYSEMAKNIETITIKTKVDNYIGGGYDRDNDYVKIYYTRGMKNFTDNADVRCLANVKMKLKPATLTSILHELFESIYIKATNKYEPRYSNVFENSLNYTPSHAFAVQKEMESIDILMKDPSFRKYISDLERRKVARKIEINRF